MAPTPVVRRLDPDRRGDQMSGGPGLRQSGCWPSPGTGRVSPHTYWAAARLVLVGWGGEAALGRRSEKEVCYSVAIIYPFRLVGK